MRPLLVVFFLALLVSCGSKQEVRQPEPQSFSFAMTDDDRVCKADSDCAVLENPDCCGCTAGGSAVAVRRDRLEALTARLHIECEEQSCPSVMSTHPTCLGTVPTCVASSCELVAK